MAALKKFSVLIISYLSVLALVGVVSIYSVGQSMASTLEIVGSDQGLSVIPADASVFNIENIYPGKTETSKITIRNDGSDPFNLVIDLTSSGHAELIDVLSVKISDPGKVYYDGLLANAILIDIGEIAAGVSQVLNLAVTMSPDAGNETQNKSFSTTWAFNAVSLGTDPGDEDPATPVTPVTTDDTPFDPFDLFPDTPAETAADVPVPAELVTAAVAEVPGEQTVVTTPEQTQVQPEEPQVVPLVEDSIALYWPFFLLLLVPLLIWFVAGSSVVVLVPDGNGKYKTVALRLAGRRDKQWFVNVEKLLGKYLERHGKVIVDFRGAFVRDAKTSVYAGEKKLGSSEMRYAIINERRLASWADNLKQQVSRIAG
jgi:hypothetical protein